MTTNSSLLNTLFHTRNDLYVLNPKDAKEPTLTSLKENPNLNYFQCGIIQAPYYGTRKIFVHDSGDTSNNSQSCTTVLQTIVNLMRSHVQTDKNNLNSLKHPDQDDISRRVEDNLSALAQIEVVRHRSYDENVVNLTIEALFGVSPFDKREHTPLFF